LLISRLAKSLGVGNNRKVSFVTNPQIWTMIGVFCTVLFGSLGLFGRMIRSDISALSQKIDGVERRLDAKIDGVDNRLDTRISTEVGGLRAVMDARFADVDHRFESLEADMRLIKGHLIGKVSA